MADRAVGACPLVVVSGVCGGAGTSSVALAVAAEGAARCDRPVLVAETAAHGLDLASGVRSPVTWQELGALCEGPPVSKVWADRGAVRVVTAGAGPPLGGGEQDALIADARAAHALLVFDNGRGTELAVAPGIRSVVVVPANRAGLDGAQARLGRRGQPADVIAVVAIHGSHRPPVREVRRALRGLGEAIVLIPHAPELVTRPAHAGELLRASACEVLSQIGGFG